MKSPLEAEGHVPEEILQHIGKMRGWLKELPEKHPRWSIHGIVRAMCNTFPLVGWQPVDGSFVRRNFEHAWLAKRDVQMVFILDVMPHSGMGGPLLVAQHRAASLTSSPWAESYMGDMQRFQPRQTAFLREAEELMSIMGPLKTG